MLCYPEMCFSPAIGTCLITGQVPRCKVSCSVYVVDLSSPFAVALSTKQSVLPVLSAASHMTGLGRSEEQDNKKHWSAGKQA